jgi:hypothetical protein
MGGVNFQILESPIKKQKLLDYDEVSEFVKEEFDFKIGEILKKK